LITCFRRIKAQQRGLPKIRTKCDPSVLCKGDLKGKMAMFGRFFQSVPQKIDIFSADVMMMMMIAFISEVKIAFIIARKEIM